MNQQAINLVANELLNRGVKPEVAAGAIAGIMGESGPNIDPLSFNDKDPHGGAGGIVQWNDDRLVGDHGLLAYARAHGVDVDVNTPTDSKKVPLAVQANFLGHELDTRYNGVLKGLQSLNTGEEGLNLWVNNYEVPLDKTGAINQRRQYIAQVSPLIGAKTPLITASGGNAPAEAAATAGGAATAYKPPDPMAVLGASLGQDLASMSNSFSSGSGGTRFADPPDQPAIRAPALYADFTPPAASPVPANLAGLGPQLGSLAIQTQQTPFAGDPNGSITQGAPSMTAMLGQLGSPNPANPGDPRATNTPNPYARYTRLG
jgi:hypothetical protein